MADRPVLPADLPTDWTDGQIVAPNGEDVGSSRQHGYNYLMEQVNAAQIGVNALSDAQGGLDTAVDALNKEVSKKADAATVTAELAKKANTADVNAALAKKADAATVTAELAKKANTADVNAALAKKADAATVNAALAAITSKGTPVILADLNLGMVTSGSNGAYVAIPLNDNLSNYSMVALFVSDTMDLTYCCLWNGNYYTLFGGTLERYTDGVRTQANLIKGVGGDWLSVSPRNISHVTGVKMNTKTLYAYTNATNSTFNVGNVKVIGNKLY